jgi:hypothetical protein
LPLGHSSFTNLWWGLLQRRGDLLCCGDLDLWVSTSHQGLLRWCGDLLGCGVTSLSSSVAPTNLRPARAERYIFSRGSLATTIAASSVFGMVVLRAMTDMYDKSKFCARLFLSPGVTLSSWEVCPLGRPPLVCVWLVELSTAHRALNILAASLRSSSCCIWARRCLWRWSGYWYPMCTFLVACAGRTAVPVMAALTVSNSACVSRTICRAMVLLSSVVLPPVPGAWYLTPLVRLVRLSTATRRAAV